MNNKIDLADYLRAKSLQKIIYLFLIPQTALTFYYFYEVYYISWSYMFAGFFCCYGWSIMYKDYVKNKEIIKIYLRDDNHVR